MEMGLFPTTNITAGKRGIQEFFRPTGLIPKVVPGCPGARWARSCSTLWAAPRYIRHLDTLK
jgi:hypothetical protein